MKFLDEDGRVFGRVNIIDVLVVLLTLAVLAAGIVAVVAPFGGSSPREPATRYATVDLGAQPLPVADRISAGDTMAIGGIPDNLSVTDTYVAPGGSGNARVVVRVRANGSLVERGGQTGRVFRFEESRLRRGDSLSIATPEYNVDGAVLNVTPSGDTLDTGQLPILLETRLPAATAEAIETGDTYRIDDRTVATIRRADISPTGNRNRSALLGLTVRTINYSGNTYFGDTPVTIGREVRFSTATYAFSGPVTELGTRSLSGGTTNTTVDVELTNVDPAIADGIEVGMVERHNGVTTARIVRKRTEPSTVVLRSENGSIYGREHPIEKDVNLTVELRARRTEDGLRFHTKPLREGANVTFEFRNITVDGTVIEIGSGSDTE